MTKLQKSYRTKPSWIGDGSLLSKEELLRVVKMIDFVERNPSHVDQLRQLHTTGPVWDGNVIDKSARNDLIAVGAAARVICEGQPGYTACTCAGGDLLEIYGWLSEEKLENTYQADGFMTFGHALVALKAGKQVARTGWNGKGMFLTLNKGNIDQDARPSHDPLQGGVSLDLFQYGPSGTVTRMPNINMRAADGSTVTGWLASQTDMLATDWGIVE